MITTLSPTATSFGRVISTVVLLLLPSCLFSLSPSPVSLFRSSVKISTGLVSGVVVSLVVWLFCPC